MRLILVRHAEAVDLGEAGANTDFDRSLTNRGERQAEALAEALRARGIAPNAILTSPLVRAVQTAEPLVAALTPGREAVVSERLAAGSLRPKKVSKAVAELGGDVYVLVGHQPDLGEYLGWLIGASGENIKFEKGAAACVAVRGEIEEGAGVLEWLITPAWFLTSGVALDPKGV